MTRRAESLVLLEACWHLKGPDERVLFCAIYEHDRGVEVRCTHGRLLQRTEYVRSLAEGRALAKAWGEGFLGNGWHPHVLEE